MPCDSGSGNRRGSGAPSWRRLRRDLSVPLTDRTFLDARGGPRAGQPAAHRGGGDGPAHPAAAGGPTSRLLASITDESRKEAVDGRPVDEGTDDALAGTLDVEDLPLLLALAAWRGQLSLPEASHLVLDEAEDFSLFDLETLARLLRGTRSVTVAGDEAQQTSPSFAGWERALETLGAGRRRPSPAPGLLPLPEAHRRARPGHPRAARPGAAGPRGARGRAGGTLLLPRRAAGAPLPRRRRCASCSSPSRTPRSRSSATTPARHAASPRWWRSCPRAVWCSTAGSASSPGLDVTDVDSVKGLEWDYVVVPDAVESAWPLSDDGRRRLHVAVTRASWQLWLVSPGTPTRLLSGDPADARAARRCRRVGRILAASALRVAGPPGSVLARRSAAGGRSVPLPPVPAFCLSTGSALPSAGVASGPGRQQRRAETSRPSPAWRWASRRPGRVAGAGDAHAERAPGPGLRHLPAQGLRALDRRPVHLEDDVPRAEPRPLRRAAGRPPPTPSRRCSSAVRSLRATSG